MKSDTARFTVTTNLRWPPEIRDQIAARAARNFRSANSEIVAILQAALEAEESTEETIQAEA